MDRPSSRTNETDEGIENVDVCNVHPAPGSKDDPKLVPENNNGDGLSPVSPDSAKPEDDLVVFPDISKWPAPVPDALRVSLVRRGSSSIQNKEGPFAGVCREGDKSKGGTRHLTSKWFYISSPNGEKTPRTWLIYSKPTGKLFCFCCRLFAKSVSSENQSNFISGFSSWWKLSPKVHDHEISPAHLRCQDDWKVLTAGLKHGKTFDAVNQLVELLSRYDAPLNEHLLKAKAASHANKQVTSYLSSTIQNEFISILGNHVRQKIVRDIKKAKYFGIIFDSTPDMSHIDQMSQVIRYVHINDNGTVAVKESFLGFFPISGKSVVELTGNILDQLTRDGLDIGLCRGQGYDNAASMAGLHGGVQAKIKEINPKALFVPCANHSLNLCGVHAFSSGPECVTFFGTLERIYSIFSVSTHRWEILKGFGLAVKRVCSTRWSASYEAVKVVRANFHQIVLALEALADPKENSDTRGAVQILLPAVCRFSFICYLYLWNEVLREVDDTQKYLQKSGLSLQQCAVKLRSLKTFLDDCRDQIVVDSMDYATAMCTEMDISMEKRVRYRKIPGESSKKNGVTMQDECRVGMTQCLDRFRQELETRSVAFSRILSVFDIVQPTSLLNFSKDKLESSKTKLTEVFDEVSNEEIVLEALRLRRHLEAVGISNAEAEKWNAVDFLEFIHKWEYTDSLPNLELCLRLFLTVCVSVASCERSFSKLKLIKSFLRSTMGEERLKNLAILSIEHEYVGTIDFDEVLNEFAELKSRRMPT